MKPYLQWALGSGRIFPRFRYSRILFRNVRSEIPSIFEALVRLPPWSISVSTMSSHSISAIVCPTRRLTASDWSAEGSNRLKRCEPDDILVGDGLVIWNLLRRLALHPASTVVKLFLTILSYWFSALVGRAGHCMRSYNNAHSTLWRNVTEIGDSAVNKAAPKFPISVVALRAEAYSFDDKSVIITTKYSSAERTYSVPLECFHDIVLDLQRLTALAETKSSVEER